MDFKKIVGTTFQESSFFAQVQFEVECNREKYLEKNYHIFFEKTFSGDIVITEFIEHRDRHTLDSLNKASFFKREFAYLSGGKSWVSIQLCRLDRSGRFAHVGPDYTHTQETGICYLDEFDHLPSLTPNELREAFQELAKILTYSVDSEHSRQKKAV